MRDSDPSIKGFNLLFKVLEETPRQLQTRLVPWGKKEIQDI